MAKTCIIVCRLREEWSEIADEKLGPEMKKHLEEHPQIPLGYWAEEIEKITVREVG